MNEIQKFPGPKIRITIQRICRPIEILLRWRFSWGFRINLAIGQNGKFGVIFHCFLFSKSYKRYLISQQKRFSFKLAIPSIFYSLVPRDTFSLTKQQTSAEMGARVAAPDYLVSCLTKVQFWQFFFEKVLTSVFPFNL